MPQQAPIPITKASGEQELFDPQKLARSLRKAGAQEALVERIVADTMAQLYPGMPTKKIYQQAFAQLRKATKPSAARYKLKQALMELGPSGFPFERLVGALLQVQGYQVLVGQLMQGRCVQHEVDVVAEQEGVQLLVECKYHNHQGRVSDVKVPLYIKARFDDIRHRWEDEHKGELQNGNHLFERTHKGAIFTNTRFTGDAQQYGSCSGLLLVSWDYPQQGSLRELIDTSRLYPLTSLTSLSRAEEQRLLEQGLVLCRELIGQEEALLAAGVKSQRLKGVQEEIAQLCG
ncbi:ATP cone domain-containing protein [Cesiribacter andamanensis]|uniref:ATP-cone domain-containing protein n=1 Tax=Cesiribacter andamanensis AMV16 TaxID=1279009 RepID=M7N638_9BACT|nr:ATP cone domain-containing protein [Cesiribacter andamanensis]EMR04093.1 hypothetical protein ADICEAN_00716 [Cesiribacter andamanensis AMV16]